MSDSEFSWAYGIAKLDRCWVCGALFSDRGGTANREEHHIVPRQAGGEDGPQVSLCETHHGKAHKMAYKIPKKESVFEWTRGEPQICVERLMRLATVIANAFAATKNDKNKKRFATITLGAQHSKMVADLKRIYPKAKSREAIFLLALEALHKRNFTG